MSERRTAPVCALRTPTSWNRRNLAVVQGRMTVLPPLYLLADLLGLDPGDPRDYADLDALAALLARRLLIEADAVLRCGDGVEHDDLVVPGHEVGDGG